MSLAAFLKIQNMNKICHSTQVQGTFRALLFPVPRPGIFLRSSHLKICPMNRENPPPRADKAFSNWSVIRGMVEMYKANKSHSLNNRLRQLKGEVNKFWRPSGYSHHLSLEELLSSKIQSTVNDNPSTVFKFGEKSNIYFSLNNTITSICF